MKFCGNAEFLAKITFVLVSLDYFAADDEVDIGDIACSETFKDLRNNAIKCEGNVWKGRCDKDCWNKTGYVCGTVKYCEDSLVCKSAVHDLRISTWNVSARSITFHCFETGRLTVVKSSIRQKIESEPDTYVNPVYSFVSPRISEKILDIVSLHHNYMFQDEKHKQECRIAIQANRNISFTPYNRNNIVQGKIRDKGSYRRYYKSWKAVNKNRAFWCRPDDSMLSNILSLAMENNAFYLPEQLTITASKGDAVTLEMHPQIDGFQPKWRKNGRLFSSAEKFKIKFTDLEIGHTGLYSLNEGWQEAGKAITRLIVRVCKSGMYGPSCESACPTCLNGGICHDITGECICPPGFNESDCGNACGKERFGRDCNQQCLNESEQEVSCKEVLFCLPDPYGCSCISGFHTLFCNETCDNGKYGAGCTQTCSNHCREGVLQSCDPYTGSCSSGCEDGWHGSSCFQSYPVLKDPPTVKTNGSNNVTVSFKEWEQGVDVGIGEVDFYIIEYTDYLHTTWTNGKQLNNSEIGDDRRYIATIENLQPDSPYFIRIIVVDKSGSMQKNNISEVKTHTKCGVPQEPPTNISINSTLSRNISVKWELPDRNTWQCQNVTVTLSYTVKNNTRSENRLWKKEFSFRIEPYTEFSVQLKTVSRDGLKCSDWSDIYKNISAEDAPTGVTNISSRSSSRQIFLTWDKPLKENGVVRTYSVKYRQIEWLHSCAGMNWSDREFSVNSTEAVIEVYPSAKYQVNISATTVKQGPWDEIVANTTEEVPDGPPTKLETFSVKAKELSFKWNPPPCNIANGKITKYNYTIKALEKWDTMNHSSDTEKTQIQFGELFPFTTYAFKVSAGTSIGISTHSANITAKTLSEKPPPPTKVSVYYRTASVLSLSWKPPYPPNGLLVRYQVSYSYNMSEEIKEIVGVDKVSCTDERKADLHCYTLKNLTANQNYSIKVFAYNENVTDGGDYFEAHGETMESVPDPPTEATLINRTETSLDIAWNAPRITNGNLTRYRINITAVNSYNKTVIGGKQSQTTGPNTLNICFQDLHPATEYNTTVEARTAVGYGLPLFDLFTTRHSVPIIDFEPEVLFVTDSTVELNIKPIDFTGGPISGYFVIVQEVKRRAKREIEEIRLITFNNSVENGIGYYVAAKFSPDDITASGINFTVGDGKIYCGFYNSPLVTGSEYMLGVAVLSNYSEEELIGHKFLSKAVRIEYPTKEAATKNVAGTVIGILFVVFVIFIAILVVAAYRKPEWLSKIRRQNALKKKDGSPTDRELINMSMVAINLPVENESTLKGITSGIPVSRLEAYVQDALQSGLLKQEFMSVEKGQCHSWDYSKLPENRQKNRYGNLLAYDHTRVVLSKVPGDPHSDYINANFVDGYCKPKKYIATQGPKSLTALDFWRMVWQKHSCKIIMCTNLVESGKTKCEKYWPDVVEKYGPIHISLINTEMFVDYTIRTFRATKEGEKREIKHFHFTTWPDHGVPMYATAVANFMQKTRTYQPLSTSPIIIHCSAGVGRTGTLILIDSMLDMAAVKQSVDLTTHLRSMREQRINLVETLDQYCFVYNALVDALCRENTAIPCPDYIVTLEKMKEIDVVTGKTTFSKQFQRLSDICPPLKNVDSYTGRDSNNQFKNRNTNIIPPDHARPFLIAPKDNPNSTYINAVFVNGYRRKDAFIVTQVPLPETVADFWNMLYHSDTNTIVLLNMLEPADETSPQYWPEASKRFCDIEVVNIGTEECGVVVVRTFELRKQKEETPKTIKQFHLIVWHPSDSLPPVDSTMFLYLMEKVERWQQQCLAKSIVVQCFNGVRACGIYCTAVFTCDKIKAEQEVDVFLAVKSIRCNRPEFIENEVQYIYCHQIALTILDSFMIYANFQ